MAMDSRTTLVQIRMTEDEKALLRATAQEYRLDVSEFLRKLVEFAAVEKPALLRPQDAPTPEIANG